MELHYLNAKYARNPYRLKASKILVGSIISIKLGVRKAPAFNNRIKTIAKDKTLQGPA